ncbi:zinc metalloproteinase nas-4-like isoform X2 [Montipora capricornis]
MDDIEKANDAEFLEQTQKNVFESDIQLTESDKESVDTRNTSPSDNAMVDVDSIVTKRKAIGSKRRLWITKEVPVALDSTATEAWNNILAAAGEIESKSCIRFRLKEKGDDHWILFVKKNGCNSPVGRQYLKKGPQLLSIGKGCNEKGIILHELLHALGFWHEQSRSDRDDYLEILWKNIRDDQGHNFNRYRKKYVDYAGGVYDYSSIMHYGNFAFSRNGRPTMLSVKDPALRFGQIKAMSDTDVIQLNAMYDCRNDKSSGWSGWGNWSPCDKGCTKVRERFCPAKDISKCPGANSDRIQEQTRNCPNDECYVPIDGYWGRWGRWSRCTVSCGQGYKTRSRECDNPQPLYGGKYCEGTLVMARGCMVKKSCRWRKKRTGVTSTKNKHRVRMLLRKRRRNMFPQRFVDRDQTTRSKQK